MLVVGPCVVGPFVGFPVGDMVACSGGSLVRIIDGTGTSELSELRVDGTMVDSVAEGAVVGAEELASCPPDGCAVDWTSALDGDEDGSGDGASATCHACNFPP